MAAAASVSDWEREGSELLLDFGKASTAGEESQFAADGSGPTRREVGHEAQWTLSSAKFGSGVEQLRDNDLDTFWQSDGHPPHTVSIQFHRMMKIQAITLALDITRDDSYTPRQLSIRAGESIADLREVAAVECKDPRGWVVITLPVRQKQEEDEDDAPQPDHIRCRLIHIVVLSSHQNGRDTHIRQIKIYSPRRPLIPQFGSQLPRFTSKHFITHSTIR